MEGADQINYQKVNQLFQTIIDNYTPTFNPHPMLNDNSSLQSPHDESQVITGGDNLAASSYQSYLNQDLPPPPN